MKNRLKVKKKKIIVVLFVLLMVALGWFYKNRKNFWNGRDDFRFTVLSDDKIALVSVSVERRMLNVLELDGEVGLWVPGGYGWYKSNKVKKLLEQENKMDLLDNVFFYNFGFVGRKNVFVNSFSDWDNLLVLWKNFGLFNMLSLRVKWDEFLLKEEFIDSRGVEFFSRDKILSRDFADNELLSGELKVSIINKSGENGLANFLARRLTWMGYLVLRVETGLDLQDKCFLRYGAKETDDIILVGLLEKFFMGCQPVYSDFLDELELELELGKDFPKLIEYSSYKKEN
ncbi:hypothetical protein KKE45_03605 [Patescibacteria group bacterium]|nr:hypothetical protein [Patescibacteria group bacterium]